MKAPPISASGSLTRRVLGPALRGILGFSISFDALGIIEGRRMVLTGKGEPEQIQGARVSATLLPMLGARPAFGRLFTDEEDRPDHDRVAVIGEALWRRRFDASPAAVGRPITLDGVPRTIVGIVPASFHLPQSQPARRHARPRWPGGGSRRC